MTGFKSVLVKLATKGLGSTGLLMTKLISLKLFLDSCVSPLQKPRVMLCKAVFMEICVKAKL